MGTDSPLDDERLDDYFARKHGGLIEDDEDLGPCASRPTPKYWPSLEIRKKSGARYAFPYGSFTLLWFDESRTMIVIEVATPDGPWQVVIHGIRIDRIFSYLHQHRLEWISEGHRDFGLDDKGFIENTTVKPIDLTDTLRHKLGGNVNDRQLRLTKTE